MEYLEQLKSRFRLKSTDCRLKMIPPFIAHMIAIYCEPTFWNARKGFPASQRPTPHVSELHSSSSSQSRIGEVFRVGQRRGLRMNFVQATGLEVRGEGKCSLCSVEAILWLPSALLSRYWRGYQAKNRFFAV